MEGRCLLNAIGCQMKSLVPRMGSLFCLPEGSPRSSNTQAIVIALGNPLNLTVRPY